MGREKTTSRGLLSILLLYLVRRNLDAIVAHAVHFVARCDAFMHATEIAIDVPPA
jgi:hypothetical protein